MVLAACTVRPDAYDLDGTDVELVFFHTGDIHSRLIPYHLDVGQTDITLGLKQANGPFGGIARLSSLVRQERRDAERFAYVETGDAFQGAPIFNAFAGEPELLALTNMGVDAMAIGNHEFDNGAPAFVEQAKAYSNFPMLAVNYLLEDPNQLGAAPTAEVTQPYMIINMKGIRVGVIGLGNLGSMRSVFKGGNSLGITPLNTVKILQSYVDYLRPQVDLVVAIGHIGYHEDLDFIPRVEGLDIVFDGHLHIALDPPNVIQGCDIAKLKREIDRYECDTPAKLRDGQRACENAELCDSKASPAEIEKCKADCLAEAQQSCDQQRESFRYEERLKELRADIKELEDRKCHPRDVLLVHSGAFLKYAGRLQVTVRQCTRLEQRTVCTEYDESGQCRPGKAVNRRCVGRNGGRDDWEVISSKYSLIPIDKRLPDDPVMLRLIEPYIFELNRIELLTQIVGYAGERVRRFSTGAGDSQLGNLVADAMQLRNQVWADFAVTNSLGIRSDMVQGPVDREQMNNVFPFENSIAVMYLSGSEVQEMMDFIAQRSTNRGCQSQAQVSGLTATLNCGGCPGDGGNSCSREPYNGEACAQRVTIGGSGRACRSDDDCHTCVVDMPNTVTCTDDKGCRESETCSGGFCDEKPEVKAALAAACKSRPGDTMGEICSGQKHPEFTGFTRCWMPISCARSYKLATNDYISRGGSGFQILERNTTQDDLEISLRQAAVDFMKTMPACGEIGAKTGYQPGSKRTFLVTEEHEAQLKTMENLARVGDFAGVSEGLAALGDALATQQTAAADFHTKSAYDNYLKCSDLGCACRTNDDCKARFNSAFSCNRGMCERDGVTLCNGLASRLVVECRQYKVSNRDKCEALGRVRAAQRCVTVPCINAKEDGRLQRIFKDSSGSPNPFDPWPE